MIDEYILLMFKKLFLVIFFSLNTFSEDLDLECKGTIGWVIEQDFGEIVMSLNLNLLEKTGHILLPLFPSTYYKFISSFIHSRF